MGYINQNLDDYVETPGDQSISRSVQRIRQGQQFTDSEMYDGHGYNRTGHLTKTNLTVGGNYNNKIYVGMGLNFHTADFDQGDSYRGVLLQTNLVLYMINSIHLILNLQVDFLFLPGLLGKLQMNSV